MDELLNKLKNYSRQLELEDSLPYWEGQQPELQARILELEKNQTQKELELQSLKAPGFLQKIFGKAEEKKDKLSKQIREIAAAQTAARWELKSLEEKIAAGRQEWKGLTGSRTAYEEAKRNAVLTPAQESCLMMEEISAFAPAALKTAERILEDLENAAFRIERGQCCREVESLEHAEAAAKRLFGILSVLPEGIASVGSYLRSPYDHMAGEARLDRLAQAQEQIRTVRNQLSLLLGET